MKVDVVKIDNRKQAKQDKEHSKRFKEFEDAVRYVESRRDTMTAYAAFCEYQSKLHSERMTKASDRLYKERRHMGILPYGFDRKEDGMLVKNKFEQRVISTIMQMRGAGYSLQKIADFLNNSGIKTKKGKLYHRATIMHIIRRMNGEPILRDRKRRPSRWV